VTTRSKSRSVRGGIIKFALAGALIAIPVGVVGVPAYATPGGTPNASAHSDALPAPPPVDTPSTPPPPAPPQYNNSNDDYYYCGGCDGGGGGGGGG